MVDWIFFESYHSDKQMIKRVHCKQEKYTIYCGRPSKFSKNWGFGNPWVISYGQGNDRDSVIEKFKNWLTTGENYNNIDATEERRQWILDNLHTLDGEICGCFCGPGQKCHVDILIELFEKQNVTNEN